MVSWAPWLGVPLPGPCLELVGGGHRLLRAGRGIGAVGRCKVAEAALAAAGRPDRRLPVREPLDQRLYRSDEPFIHGTGRYVHHMVPVDHLAGDGGALVLGPDQGQKWKNNGYSFV